MFFLRSHPAYVFSLSLSFRPYSLADYAPLHNIIVYLALSAMKQRRQSALEFVSRSGDNADIYREREYCLYYVVKQILLVFFPRVGSRPLVTDFSFFSLFQLELVTFSYADRGNNFGELLNISPSRSLFNERREISIQCLLPISDFSRNFSSPLEDRAAFSNRRLYSRIEELFVEAIIERGENWIELVPVGNKKIIEGREGGREGGHSTTREDLFL